MKSQVTIIDYNMGNIHSLLSAVKYLGYNCKVSNKVNDLREASHLILPGVGEFKTAISNLEKLDLVEEIKSIYKRKRAKILGICLGMQLLSESSSEGGGGKGLGLIPCSTEKLNSSDGKRIPHIGFNEVIFPKESLLGSWTDSPKDFYFVHSYCLPFADLKNAKVGLTSYAQEFISLYENDPIYATQFHPEKSQTNGLYLLKSFLEL